MTFNEYLISKKIDQHLFEKFDCGLYKTWEYTFNQIHPLSFTEQNKFLLNSIRKKYLLKKPII
jgi:hypothetical protein